MPFHRINFIKANRIFDPREPGFAPMFRRKFSVNEPISSAIVHVCGLGYAYYWLNGQAVTEDLFISWQNFCGLEKGRGQCTYGADRIGRGDCCFCNIR